MPEHVKREPYRVASIESISLTDHKFLIVDTYSIGKRTHRRVLVKSSQDSQLVGKPILYLDLYGNVDENPRIYAYARHAADVDRFVHLLNHFISGNENSYKELRDKQFHIWTNVDAELKEFKAKFPISPDMFQGPLSFMRVSIPFGDIAIEFCPPQAEIINELTQVERRELPGMIEAPLFGCDVTQSIESASLLASLHWARDTFISPDIFKELFKLSTRLPQLA